MSNLEEIIEDVILTHESNDTKDFFSRIQLCLIECIEKLEEGLLNDYEKIILFQAKSHWIKDSNCVFEIFKNFRILIGLKRSSETTASDQRINALDVMNGVLLTYEDYEPEEKEERINSIDYCVFYLLNAGANEKDLISIITKHFS